MKKKPTYDELEKRISDLEKELHESKVDIKQLRSTEESLIRSESKYRKLIETASDGIYLISEDGKFVDANPAACNMLGRSKEEITQLEISDVDPSYTVEQFVDFWKKIPYNHPLILETIHIHKDGSLLPVEISAQKFKIGENDFYFGISRSIVEREKAKQALVESEEKYRSIFENAQDAIFIADPETGIILDANQSAELLTGYSKEELIGKHHTFLHPTEKADFYKEAFKKAIDHINLRFAESLVQTRDGRLVPVEICSGGTVYTEKNKIHIGIFRDITERRQAEQALRDSESRFRMLFDNMNEGFFLAEIICDETGKPFDYRFLGANPAHEKVSGLKNDDIMGKTISEVLLTHSPWIEIFGRVALTGIPERFEAFSGLLNRYLAISAFSPRSGQFACLVQDITERKEWEHALQKAHDELGVRVEERTAELSAANKSLKEYSADLEKLNQELQEFSFVVSHDFQEPLRKIQTFGRIVVDQYADQLGEQGKDYLLRITSAAERMSQLLRSLLEYSRVR